MQSAKNYITIRLNQSSAGCVMIIPTYYIDIKLGDEPNISYPLDANLRNIRLVGVESCEEDSII